MTTIPSISVCGPDQLPVEPTPAASAAPEPAEAGDEREAVLVTARRAREAAVTLRRLTRLQKDAALRAMAQALRDATPTILAANALDVQRAVDAGTAAGIVDRLTLTESRLADIADALAMVADLPDPVEAKGTAAERHLAFADSFRMLRRRIELFVNLPLQKIDRLALKDQLDEIGRT